MKQLPMNITSLHLITTNTVQLKIKKPAHT